MRYSILQSFDGYVRKSQRFAAFFKGKAASLSRFTMKAVLIQLRGEGTFKDFVAQISKIAVGIQP